jgi:hypothetical protein
MSDLLLTSGDGINTDANIYPGQVPTADQWNFLFAGKVDANNGYLTNPTVFGYLSLTEAPSQDVHAASKSYVDGKISGSSIPDAPSDGTPYCRQNNAWQPAPTQLAASVAGNLTIPGSLVVGQGATVTGDSAITGRLTVHGALAVDTTITSGGAATFTGGILGTPIGQGGATTPGSFSSVIIASQSIYNTIPGLPVGYTYGLRIAADPATASNVFLDAWAAPTGLNGRRASGTPSSPTGLAGNTVIAALNAFGHDGGAYTTTPQASYQIKTLNSWSTGDHSTQHQWSGTSSGATTSAAWLTLVNSRLVANTVNDSGYAMTLHSNTTGALAITAETTTDRAVLSITNTVVGNANWPMLNIGRARNAGTGSIINGQVLGLNRWTAYLGDATNEGGANAGSDFGVQPSDDSGNPLPVALRITRATGATTLAAGLGIWGHTPPATQPSFTGAKGGNTALASVIAALVAAGIGIDTTTA